MRGNERRKVLGGGREGFWGTQRRGRDLGGATHTSKSLLLGTHTQRAKGVLTPFQGQGS